ncbi:MAG TPA: hypothetical protein DCF33_08320 [Saprospirales bacterium]|nr:hypothetical protein [Saprospirales bacterium]
MTSTTNLLANFQHAKSDTFPEINEGVFSEQAHQSANFIFQSEDEDKIWLATLETAVLRKLGYFKLSASMLAEQMAISRPTFFRKVKHLTGLTPQQYIVEMRFCAARVWLETRRYSRVKTVAISAGFRDVEHFSKQFRKRFGKRPSDYLA